MNYTYLQLSKYIYYVVIFIKYLSYKLKITKGDENFDIIIDLLLDNTTIENNKLFNSIQFYFINLFTKQMLCKCFALIKKKK